MAVGGRKESFHKIQPTDLTRVEVDCNYSNVTLLGKGRSSKIYSAKDEKTETELVLKCIDKETSNKMDFFREFHYTYHLSPHPNIVKSYNVAFDTVKSYVFVQELASEGDLSHIVKMGCLEEDEVKRVVEQISSALEFVHSKELVHRDICLENIFVYDKDFKKVKLGDFGLTKQIGTLVKKGNQRIHWSAPEVCQALAKEGYHISPIQDAWQLGILIFVCLTGFFPWSCADITDYRFNEWIAWHKRKTNKLPRGFRAFTPRLIRLFRRLLDPKTDMRYGVKEVRKYLSDPWIAKTKESIEVPFDEELSVHSPLNKRNTKLIRHSSTRSASSTCYAMGLKRGSSARSSASSLRAVALKRNNSTRSAIGKGI
ncbi:unnamed protein product [Meganyctiphanes norvegica]|uniref:Protein kinase domain-containing protein n=1 Tax=Meganyctiphanes norvegica TaxID=48144 RepID=A0AAV2RWW7_MEGNR